MHSKYVSMSPGWGEYNGKGEEEKRVRRENERRNNARRLKNA